MSDTPRTDAEFKREGHIYIHTGIGAMEYVSLAFARQLERELAEARKDAEKWQRIKEDEQFSVWRYRNGWDMAISKKDLDAAIDAARREHG